MILFVTLTRHPAGRPLRVNAPAIAYTDACEGGCMVAFGSGDAIVRVRETQDEVEQRVQEALAEHGASAPKSGKGRS